MTPIQLLSFFSRRVHIQHRLLLLTGALLVSSILFAACSGIGGGTTTPTATPSPANLALAKLHWCGKANILFRDEHAPVTATTSSTPATKATATTTATATSSPTTTPSGPTTVTNWSQVEPNLGFSVYLPTTLPNNTCLVSASGTFHDPIFGGSFNIGYLLPDHSSITLAEAPERANSLSFQCSPAGNPAPKAPIAGTPTTTASATGTANPLLLCTGARSNTNIVFSAPGSQTTLQQFFNNLQPNVAWVPAA